MKGSVCVSQLHYWASDHHVNHNAILFTDTSTMLRHLYNSDNAHLDHNLGNLGVHNSDMQFSILSNAPPSGKSWIRHCILTWSIHGQFLNILVIYGIFIFVLHQNESQEGPCSFPTGGTFLTEIILLFLHVPLYCQHGQICVITEKTLSFRSQHTLLSTSFTD